MRTVRGTPTIGAGLAREGGRTGHTHTLSVLRRTSPGTGSEARDHAKPRIVHIPGVCARGVEGDLETRAQLIGGLFAAPHQANGCQKHQTICRVACLPARRRIAAGITQTVSLLSLGSVSGRVVWRALERHGSHRVTSANDRARGRAAHAGTYSISRTPPVPWARYSVHYIHTYIDVQPHVS